MKNTKERVFDQILLLRKATIAQLSEKIGVSEISIRHHLMSMEAEGIVASAEERHGVGRPRFVYFLTEKGFKECADQLPQVVGSSPHHHERLPRR